jgi:hypothetical protein
MGSSSRSVVERAGSRSTDPTKKIDEALDDDEGLRKSGRDIVSDALQPVHTATTIRMRNGQVLTTDRPFAEMKEPLGRFMLIEASNLNNAIGMASKIPPARLGCREARPIMDLTCETSFDVRRDRLRAFGKVAERARI